MTARKKSRHSARAPVRNAIGESRLTIITVGEVSYNFSVPKPIDLRHEVELVKAGLLYGDSVELLSWAHVFLRQVERMVSEPNNAFCEYLASADDEFLSQMVDADGRDHVRRLARRLCLRMDVAGFDDLLASLKPGALAEFRTAVTHMHEASEVDELELASKSKFLRYSRLSHEADPTKTLDLYSAEIKRRLEDPTRFVLLDADTAELAKRMIDLGIVIPPKRAQLNAGEAALGAGFVSRLPLIPSASMEEVLQIREDLSDPLLRYRRRISQLRERVQVEPFDKAVGAEIDAIWRSDIEPVLLEIRESMSDHNLARELLDAVGADLGAFVKGSVVPAGIAVIAAQALDVGAALMSASAATIAATGPVAKAALTRRKALTQIKRHDLYYLYEIDRRLER